VCLSNAGTVSTRMDVSLHFLDILVKASFCFKRWRHYKIPRVTLSGVLYARQWAKFAVFNRNRHLSRKLYEIGPWLLWITNRKSYAVEQSVSVPVTLSDLERRDVRGQKFLADLDNYARMVWPRMTEFCVVIQVGEKHICSGSATPTSKGGTVSDMTYTVSSGTLNSTIPYQRRHGPSVLEIWGTLTYAETRRFTATKFGTVTREEWRVLGGQPRPRPKGWGPDVSQIFGTSYMLAHSMRINKQILHSVSNIELDMSQNYYKVDCECWCVVCLR